MTKSTLNKLVFIICLIYCIGSHSKASVTHSRTFNLPNLLQYQFSNHFLKHNSNYLFQNPLFYQNVSPIEDVNFCDFVIYGDNIEIRLTVHQTFGSLPDHIPHLPIAHPEEKFPIPYWIHIDMPEIQRRSVYQVVEEINRDLRFRAFTIAGIDFSEIDHINNRKDRKNVIYWLDEEEISASNQILFQRAGTVMQVPNLDVLHPSYYPILDADLIINTNIATDMQAFRFFLISHLKQFGIENPPLDADVTDLHNLLIEHLENIDVEEYRRLRIDILTSNRQMEEQYWDETRDKIPLTEEEERSSNQSLDQVDEAISHVASMSAWRLSRAAKIFRDDFIFTDLNRFQDSSSTFFQNTLKHELLHGLGSDHYIGPVQAFTNPLMRASMADFFQGSYALPEEVDLYARKSLSCIYDLDSLRQRLPL